MAAEGKIISDQVFEVATIDRNFIVICNIFGSAVGKYS